MINQKTTHDLMQVLTNIEDRDDLDTYLSGLRESDCIPFADYFRSLPSVQQFSNAELIRRSGIERTYYYQLISGRRAPGRDKILLLGLAAGLTVKEVQKALEMNHLGILYPKNRRDSILIFSLVRHLQVPDVQELLLTYDEAPLE